MPVFNFTDNDGIDIGNKYVTKDYLMDVYPNLVAGYASPQLWTWGLNDTTTLGNGGQGILGTGDATNRSSPGTTAGGTATWVQVSVTATSAAAIKSDGTLWTWGQNSQGRLGNGNTTDRSSPGTTAGGGTNWKQVAIGASTAAVKTDGTLWTWGYDGYGLLGTSTNNTSRSSPGTTAGGGTNWKQVSAGGTVFAAIKTDGTLWAWGANGNGKVGDGTTTTRSSPVTTAGGGTNWKFVNMNSGSGSVAAIKNDGTLWTWGGNGGGQLGTGNTTDRSSPGTTAGGGTNWTHVNINDSVCTAIKSDGTLWTWGSNFQGCLATGNITDRSSPGTTVGGGTDWKYVTTYGEGNSTRAAIKTDGTLWVWGVDGFGSLGTGALNDTKSSPVTVAGGGTGWKQVTMGTRSSAAIAEQGGW
jgi:YD repeat-containing protein